MDDVGIREVMQTELGGICTKNTAGNGQSNMRTSKLHMKVQRMRCPIAVSNSERVCVRFEALILSPLGLVPARIKSLISSLD